MLVSPDRTGVHAATAQTVLPEIRIPPPPRAIRNEAVSDCLFRDP